MAWDYGSLELHCAAWESDYQGWLVGGVAWELGDPDFGAHAKGGYLCGTTFQPGAVIRSSFLQDPDLDTILQDVWLGGIG